MEFSRQIDTGGFYRACHIGKVKRYKTDRCVFVWRVFGGRAGCAVWVISAFRRFVVEGGRCDDSTCPR
ncbi:hypothetical protein C4K02_2468 [Pseudomonas synxantha]|nr:hypothetical protein C4K02_2468 [Pseudomonas synxantha]